MAFVAMPDTSLPAVQQVSNGSGGMARTVRDAQLGSKAARARLQPRGKPYWRTIDPGLHIGYRRPRTGAGRWVVRLYGGRQTYQTITIAAADDISDANGVDVLSFEQAQREARWRRDERAHVSAGKGRAITVSVAIDRYLDALAGRGRDTADTRSRIKSMILPALGDTELSQLTTERIRHWIREMVNKPPRLRTGRGKPQRYRKFEKGDDALRRRRNTVNRIVAILKAALTNAFREGLVASDEPWRRVKLFENVTAARVRYLTVAEAQGLINACDPDFRNMVTAALQTGARYSELARLHVHDFNPDSGTVAILKSKSGRARHMALTDEGAAFFAELCAGRPGADVLLRRANGEPWGASNQIAPMAAACRRAGISPAVGFHALRHSYASLSVMGGAPLVVVAAALGHADTRMVSRHYGHLAQNYVADAIRAAAPRFGFGKATKGTVTPLRKAGANA
jgi:integrase